MNRRDGSARSGCNARIPTEPIMSRAPLVIDVQNENFTGSYRSFIPPAISIS